MADTDGIAALLKALNDTPALGAGLSKPRSVTPRSNAFARAAGLTGTASTPSTPTASTASTASTVTGTVNATAPTAASARPIRTATTTASLQSKPKTVISEGVAYNARAPRGSYLDLVI